FNSFEGLKRGVRPAATTIGWPVRGFLPRRGLRRPTENVPKPTRVTVGPRFSEVLMDASSARRARSDAALVQPLEAAMEATRSARVMQELLSLSRGCDISRRADGGSRRRW